MHLTPLPTPSPTGVLGLCWWLCKLVGFFGVSEQNCVPRGRDQWGHAFTHIRSEGTSLFLKPHSGIPHGCARGVGLTFAYTRNRCMGPGRWAGLPCHTQSFGKAGASSSTCLVAVGKHQRCGLHRFEQEAPRNTALKPQQLGAPTRDPGRRRWR